MLFVLQRLSTKHQSNNPVISHSGFCISCKNSLMSSVQEKSRMPLSILLMMWLKTRRRSTCNLKRLNYWPALDKKEKSPEWMKYKANVFISSREPGVMERLKKQWDSMRERVSKLEIYYNKLKRPFFNITPEAASS
jgi:hypothetical protein